MEHVLKRLSRSRRIAAGRAWWEQSLGGNGLRRVRELDLDTHALALCAQQVLCTAPLIVATGAVIQRLTGKSAGYMMTRFFGLHGSAADAVERLFGRTSTSISTLALILAMVTSVVFTTSVAVVQQRAFEMIWTLPRVIGVRSYLRQLVWAVMLGVYSGSLIVVGRVTRSVDWSFEQPAIVAGAIVQGFLTFLFYWWSQRWLLGARVTWHALLPGALAVGVLTTVLFRLTRVLLNGQISWQVHAYGLVGGVFVLSVWLMILSGIIFAGVLIGALITEERMAQMTQPGLPETSPLTAAGLESAAREGLPNDPRVTLPR